MFVHNITLIMEPQTILNSASIFMHLPLVPNFFPSAGRVSGTQSRILCTMDTRVGGCVRGTWWLLCGLQSRRIWSWRYDCSCAGWLVIIVVGVGSSKWSSSSLKFIRWGYADWIWKQSLTLSWLFVVWLLPKHSCTIFYPPNIDHWPYCERKMMHRLPYLFSTTQFL